MGKSSIANKLELYKHSSCHLSCIKNATTYQEKYIWSLHTADNLTEQKKGKIIYGNTENLSFFRS